MQGGGWNGEQIGDVGPAERAYGCNVVEAVLSMACFCTVDAQHLLGMAIIFFSSSTCLRSSNANDLSP